MELPAKLRKKLLIIPITTFILGTWQIYRLRWKKDLIKKMEDRISRDPISIPLDVKERVNELLYSQVKLSGRFDHKSELYLFPRPFNTEHIVLARYRHNHPGIQVITPFYCNELKANILVNRGWVPKEFKHPNSRPSGQVGEEMSLVGVVRSTSKNPVYSGVNSPDKNEWQYVDVAEMSRARSTEPILLDCSYESMVEGGPIGGQTRVTIRNKHLEYICVWYSLTAILSYILYKSKGVSAASRQFRMLRKNQTK